MLARTRQLLARVGDRARPGGVRGLLLALLATVLVSVTGPGPTSAGVLDAARTVGAQSVASCSSGNYVAFSCWPSRDVAIGAAGRAPTESRSASRVNHASSGLLIGAAKSADDAGQLVYRVHGGDAGKWGHSWTTENPLGMANPRSRLGLPKVNSGENVTCARVCDMGGVRKRDALPLDGNPGGGPEWLFPNPKQQLQELWSLRMEPPL